MASKKYHGGGGAESAYHVENGKHLSSNPEKGIVNGKILFNGKLLNSFSDASQGYPKVIVWAGGKQKSSFHILEFACIPYCCRIYLHSAVFEEIDTTCSSIAEIRIHSL